MRKLSEPINGTETYLAAIHEVLCDIRTALVDRSLARFVDERISEALGEVAQAVQYADGNPATPAKAAPAPSPTKRTRARTPR